MRPLHLEHRMEVVGISRPLSLLSENPDAAMMNLPSLKIQLYDMATYVPVKVDAGRMIKTIDCSAQISFSKEVT